MVGGVGQRETGRHRDISTETETVIQTETDRDRYISTETVIQAEIDRKT